MKQPKIAYIPFELVNHDNAYKFRMRELLSLFGNVVAYEGTKKSLRNALSFSTKRDEVIVANWLDNDFLDEATMHVKLSKVAKVFLKTILFRISFRRLVFIRHNNYPHATASGEEKRVKKWIDLYERLFDIVVTHSGEPEHKKRHYCPHPLYHLVDTTAIDLEQFSLPKEYYVVFGRIAPYKRLAELINAFPENKNLVIIGAVADSAYLADLTSLRRSNVYLRPGFLSEGDAQAIVSASAGLILSHADANVVVSSSFYYAMTLQVPVIALSTPFLHWIQPLVDPSLVQLASNLDSLCGLIRSHAPQTVDASAIESVTEQFGDEAMLRCLAPALRLVANDHLQLAKYHSS